MICYYYTDPTLWIFAADLPKLLYYSHVTVFVTTILASLFVLIKGQGKLLNTILFFFGLSFSGWVFINLIAWGSNNSDLTISIWPLFGIFQALIAALSVYLMYVFLYKRDMPLYLKSIISILILPVILLAPTNLTVSGFDVAWCDAFRYENQLMLGYYTVLGIIVMITILLMSVQSYFKAASTERTKILLMAMGLEFFLSLFFFLVYIGSVFANLGITDDSEIEFYAIFSMGFFIVILATLAVRFKMLNFTVHSVNVLVGALLILVASQYTYANSTTTTIALTTVTLVLTTVAGFFLIKSVRKEVQQRKQLELLTKDLESANDRLKDLDKLKSEFVSIASHQMRSPLTSIRGYASMLIEQSFGPMPEKAMDPLKRIEDSAKHMAMAVEDYLNVSRIESGNMKYNYADFNLKNETEKICDDIRPVAMEKQLVLLFRSDLKSQGIVNADIGKTIQILHNLINNSMKYTPRGSITVYMRDDQAKKRIYVDIIDTGIGISKDNITKLFQKFSRATNANSVNVTGTGLGLYVARQMAVAMGGDITAHSEGDGKGSTFTFELPLMM